MLYIYLGYIFINMQENNLEVNVYKAEINKNQTFIKLTRKNNYS